MCACCKAWSPKQCRTIQAQMAWLFQLWPIPRLPSMQIAASKRLPSYSGVRNWCYFNAKPLLIEAIPCKGRRNYRDTQQEQPKNNHLHFYACILCKSCKELILERLKLAAQPELVSFGGRITWYFQRLHVRHTFPQGMLWSLKCFPEIWMSCMSSRQASCLHKAARH